jgi:mono/diheme cytochrome c family protein
MKRVVVGVLCLAAAACGQQQSKQPAKTAQLSYEGADYKTQTTKISHGRRLADVLDCTGCHGADLQGTNLNADDPKKEPKYAPNITLLLANYSDSDLDRLIRQGVPRDGREFWFMPVESYQFLSDADLSALIAYLRTARPVGKPRPPFRKDAELEKEIAEGLIGNAQQQIAKYVNTPPAEMGEKHAWGRYLAQSTCTQCHNNALQGWKDFAPDLDIAGAYTPAELETLLTTGKGKTKADLGMMSEMGQRVFSKFTPRERAAVIAYVKERADRPR